MQATGQGFASPHQGASDFGGQISYRGGDAGIQTLGRKPHLEHPQLAHKRAGKRQAPGDLAPPVIERRRWHDIGHVFGHYGTPK